jgi:hypothetical protein
MINFENLSFFAVILLSITSTMMIISRNWRFIIALLAIQYLGVFSLVAISWPIEMAMVKLITGWIIGTVVGLIHTTSEEGRLETGEFWPAGQSFKLFFILLILITVWSLASRVEEWVIFATRNQITGSLILMALGLLQVSLVTRPFPVILGLFTFLSGFEILYSTVESSLLIAGLLAGMNLALALAGSYLIITPITPENSR